MTEQMNVPKLRFREFEDVLVNSTLAGLIESLDSGVSVNSEDFPPNSYQKGILKTSSVYLGEFFPEESKRIVDEAEVERAKLSPKKDAIIISRMNTPALVGESGYVTRDYPELFIPDRLWQASVSKSDCALWLSYLLTSPRTRYQIASKGTGTSNSMKNISKPNFLSIKVIKPILPEQQKIASFLSTVDKKIELLTKKKAKLTEYKKGVMQQLFNGSFVHNAHEAQNTPSGLNQKPTFIPPTLRFKADDGSDFPDWEESTLGDIGKVKMCKRILANQTTEDGDIPFYKIGTFGKEPDAFISRELYADFRQKYSFPNVGDILISASGTLGRTVVYDGSPSYFQDSNIVWIENDGTHTSNEFLFYIYQIVKYQSEGGTIQRLYNSIISSAKFKKPSLSEQKKVVSFLSSIDKKLELADTELSKAEEWKKGLLQQMFV